MKKYIAVLCIVLSFLLVGTGGVYALWRWENRQTIENNAVIAEAYSAVSAQYRYPGTEDDYEIAVDFTVKGFGAIDKKLRLYLSDISYSSATDYSGDWTAHLAEIWQYKTATDGEWSAFTEQQFVLESAPQHGGVYTVFLRKNPDSESSDYQNGILKFSGVLKESEGHKNMTVLAERAFYDTDTLAVTYKVDDVGEPSADWDLVLSQLGYNSLSGEDWSEYLGEIWQYRIDQSENWQPFALDAKLFENVQTGDFILYVRKNPDIREDLQPYAGGKFTFTVSLQEALL